MSNLNHFNKTEPIENEPVFFSDRYSKQFDVILMDNASECNELYSTLALLYSSSSLIFFGDAMRKPKDEMDMDRKYPGLNIDGSMFARLRQRKHCVLKLVNCYRFSPQVLEFVNEVFYNRSLQPVPRPVEYVKGFCVFHHANERVVHIFLTQLLKYFEPNDSYKFGVILPPNISVNDVEIG